MTKEEYLEFCRGISGATLDQPFDDDYVSWVARHTLSRKWFALIMRLEGRDIVTLKCDPQEADFLRSVYEGVIPAYHMNKVHWNTVYLDSDVPDEELIRMTENSFGLTGGNKQRRRKKGE